MQWPPSVGRLQILSTSASLANGQGWWKYLEDIALATFDQKE